MTARPLADLNKTVVWMVCTHPVIFKSSSPCKTLLVIIPNTPIISSRTVTFICHRFFSVFWLFFSLSFDFTLRSALTVKSTIRHVHFFLLIIIKSGRLAEIKWSFCIAKPQQSLCISISRKDSTLYVNHFLYDQISISCTVPSGSPSPPSRV